jgi:hypothetical protein
MRLPLIAPADVSPEQRPVYDDMRTGIEKNFQGFRSIAENGALMGPWNPWLHEPKFGLTDLGPDVGAFGLPFVEKHGEGGGDPCHRRNISLLL